MYGVMIIVVIVVFPVRRWDRGLKEGKWLIDWLIGLQMGEDFDVEDRID